MTWEPRRWTREQIVTALEGSKSLRQVLENLHLVPKGANYRQLRKHLRYFGIDTSHLPGRAWSRGLRVTCRPALPLKEILVPGSEYRGSLLKQRLIRAGLLPARCQICGWAVVSPDGRMPLELDHINGTPNDNRLENLRILCPNCHSLQPTHRGLNSRKAPG